MQASSEALKAKCLLAFFSMYAHKSKYFTTFASKNNCIQDKQLLSYGIDT